MTVRSTPPLPRSGRLMTGGANSLELLWALLTLAAVTLVAAASSIAWLAIRVEAWLAGTGWDVPVWEMPALLLDTAAGTPGDDLARAVVAPWRPVAAAGVLTVLLVAAVVAGLRAWMQWQDGWRHRQRTRDRLDSRVWARRRDLAGLLEHPPRGDEPTAAGRLWVGSFRGRVVLVPTATSVMVVAPTRTGKSTRLVVPNLLRWDGPAVVTSVKRDVYDLTVDRRRQIGPVALFDPTGATGLPSVRWSPLLSSTTFPDATKTATWLTDAAAVEDRHETAKFWETLATKLLAPTLYAAANDGKTITDVSHWIDRSAFDEVAEILEALGDEDAMAAWQAIADLPSETRGSVLGTAMAVFRAFGSPRVRAATSCTPGDVDNTLNIARMLKDNGTLYLVSPEYEQAELRPLFVALVQAVYRAAVDVSANLLDGAPLNPPLLLMLDEAGNIAPLQTLPKIAATGAGQGITLMTIWQDRAQIRDLYRESERTLISNHTTTVWLPGSQDLETLKLLSDLIGDQWVAASTVSAAPDGGLSVSEGSERIDVAPPAFLRTLGHGSAVVLTGNTPPALIRTHAYFQQHRWRRLIDPGQLARHNKMHNGTGHTTAARWEEKGWPDDLPSAAESAAPTSGHSANGQPPRRGSLGRTLAAGYPPIPCNRHARQSWGPGGAAIPDELRGEPGRWTTVHLPAEVAAEIGIDRLNLTEPSVRRRVLPRLLETGPADVVAATVTLPQLRAEWPHLELSDVLRDAWEQCYPALADDLAMDHPSVGIGTYH
jgi:type IV secretion system protein VirD4